jgi:hypothetical protein
MTTKILEALKENKTMFEEIEKISRTLSETLLEKGNTLREIAKLHNLVFSNFNTARKETPIKIKTTDYRDGAVVFINKDGISLKDGAYAKNTYYLGKINNNTEFVRALKQIKQKETELLQLIKKPTKQIIFKQFFEKVEDLSYEEKIDKELNKELHYFDDRLREFKIETIQLSPNHIRLLMGYNTHYLNINSLDLKDKLVIEQIYPDIIDILKEYCQDEKAKLELTKQFLEDLKVKFAKHLIVNNLNKKTERRKK